MELIKKRIHYVREGKKIFDQFYVDEDYNVPEAKEDVRRIVDTGTELKIEEIRPVENYVRITGKGNKSSNSSETFCLYSMVKVCCCHRINRIIKY